MGQGKLPSKAEVQAQSQRRAWVLLPALACGVLLLLLYFGFLFESRGWLLDRAVAYFGPRPFGIEVREAGPVIMLLPSFLIFLTPPVLAEYYVRDTRLICPLCDQDVSRQIQQVLATSRCPRCEKRLLADGQLRSRRAYRRQSERRQRRFLAYWFYIWPCLSLLALVWCWLAPDQLRENPICVFIGPLLGVATTGWVWLRTGDRACLPPLLLSVVMLALAIAESWLFLS